MVLRQAPKSVSGQGQGPAARIEEGGCHTCFLLPSPSSLPSPLPLFPTPPEFIVVGNKESGLEVLNDVIRSKKHRSGWTQDHERIMLLYTELCIDLQRSAYAKDGLYQYRNICKETSLNSFEKVIKSFLKLAEARAAEAREQSEAAATSLLEIEDLDYMQTPERWGLLHLSMPGLPLPFPSLPSLTLSSPPPSLLLSTVSGEGAKERTDRVLLMPWVKFLWESYRNMLELLKNNNTVESIYADVAKDGEPELAGHVAKEGEPELAAHVIK